MNLEKVSIRAWISNQQIKTESGKPLDFHNHRYLRDIYSDNSKYLCCLKAGQIGFSTMAILKTIWLARNYHINIGYILPTVEMVQAFVGSKVNGIASQNPQINEWMKDKDSIKLKQIDENFIHYLGAQTERAAIMLSLDMLVADEYDKAPQEILETYDSRLQHSTFGYKWVFSNPTHPDFGVDRFWNLSDKKMWHITHGCGKTFVMDETCVNYTTQQYTCPTCHNIITSEEIRMGQWIATAQGEWRGYWIPLWINPMVEAKVICEHKKAKTAEYFYNFVAGLPYVNANDTLSERALVRCLSKEINTQQGRVIIGMDTAHNLHYILMNKEGVFYNGYCPSVAEMGGKAGYDPYDQIDKLLTENTRWVLFSDQGGDLIGIRKLQAKHKGRVFLVWFTKETRNKELIRFGENEEYGKVLADRNRVFQMGVDQVNEQRTIFNGTKEDWEPFIKHATNIYRVKELTGEESDPVYGWRYVWKRKGPDHLWCAFIYALIGYDRFGGQDLAQVVKKGNMLAGIPTGFRADQGKIVKREESWEI